MLKGLKLYYQVGGISGLVKGIRGTLFGHKSVLSVVPPNSDKRVELRVPSTDVATFRQIFLFEEYDFPSEFSPRLVVDAGANTGLAAIFFALKYPDARIIAIEPEQGNFEILQRNVAPYRNIHSMRAALWNRSGEISLCDPGLGDSGFVTSAAQNKKAGNVLHMIRAVTVQDVIESFELDRIDIFKVDIEGAELEVFTDVSGWIERVDALVIELHDRIKPGCTRAFNRATKEFSTRWSVGENVFCARPHITNQ
jgi:FkbM family methyltransferase